MHTLAIDFDFIGHALQVTTSTGEERSFELTPMSVADFYRRVMSTLGEFDIEAEILARPVEVPDPIQPFPEGTGHASYDADAANRFWRTLVQAALGYALELAREKGRMPPR